MTLECPMPQTEFDIITLGHGSGGQLSAKLLQQFVFNELTNPLLATQHDGAVFEAHGTLAFSTDSYVVNPIFFPGGNIGDLAINGTLNDLAMCGATPKYLSLSFILEDGLPIQDFWRIIQTIKRICIEQKVWIITGDTKVVEKGKGDKIFINTSGIGFVNAKASLSAARVEIDDCVMVSHAIGFHGISILSQREGLQFETEIKSDTRCVSSIVQACLERYGQDIKWLRDPTRGGVATSLNELAEAIDFGISIEENALKVDGLVKGACSLFGLDPLFVANEGVFIAVVSPAIAEDMVLFLQNNKESELAFILGKICADHPKKLTLKSKIGGRRVVTKLLGDQLPRIC
ncbi:MAG: hydrogenase expression/formation protein HypE [Alphaproteobacteria bacterium]|nr:hydrogenase expression/formation protein HypE [Alphaproteobacteria bacterium]